MTLIAIPLALFLILAVLWPQPKPEITRITSVDLWVEPLGSFPFDQQNLKAVLERPLHLDQAQWKQVTLPDSIPLEADVDLPESAPRSMAWFRVRVPDELLHAPASATHGSLGLMGNRIMGGPWAVWMNGQLIQDNLSTWRIAWNTPLRVMLPNLDRHASHAEILIAVAYPDAKGYAMGSLFMGAGDAIDEAWEDRNLWHAGLESVVGAIGTALCLIALQLAIGRRKEILFALLAFNALFWTVSGFQYTNDFTDNEQLSIWFGWAVDLSVNWIITLQFLFVFEIEGLKLLRIRAFVILYSCIVSVITLPLWDWNKDAIVLQHYSNALVFLGFGCILTWNAVRQRNRENVIICIGTWIQLGFGLHDLMLLTSQQAPDEIHTFQIGTIVTFMVFMYVTNRRYIQTLNAAERHQIELQEKLNEQEIQLAAQYAELQKFEIEKSLATQHRSITQDLHDHVGSVLTSTLYMVRSGAATQSETVLLLQELGDELRNISKSTPEVERSLNDILTDIRQKFQRRFQHGDIALAWNVSPYLPPETLRNGTWQNVRAMLSEAIANITKHAKATQVTVDAKLNETDVVIEITDNGIGFDRGGVILGRGLVGMEHRASLIGATLAIQSSPAAGCIWRLTLPRALWAS